MICLQCGRTISPDRADDVTDPDGDLVPLHRHGCPTSDLDARLDGDDQ